ncbi:MAG: hybrid sensor histidine kinase/response regulator [Clostridiales bacterium]|jgi:signal transduction histidine kinase|nr:hybrid sensor histidine kinase/response regulator [Clostridiales bacterium]
MIKMQFKKVPEILIVDDTPDHIQFVANILKGKKYKVRAITSGTMIYDALKVGLPDLILLDVLMPDIDGYHICTSLKSDKRYSSIPIIFLTAMNEEEDIIKGFNAGAQDYVLKPVKPSELLVRIETHLDIKYRSDELREAYNEIESFNHMISHDLKSPIWAINKLTSYLSNLIEDKSEDIQELFATILQKSDDTVTLIEKYSEIAKLSNASIQTEEIDMNVLVKEICHDKESEILPQKVVYNVSKLPIVNGDRLLLKQALINILSNALKFSRGRETINININCIKKNTDYLFSIEDNGVGFDMNYATDIFTLYVRLHSKSEFEGTGTGLTIVKRIISIHGGKVWITGEVDKGATVYFTLPIESIIRNPM